MLRHHYMHITLGNAEVTLLRTITQYFEDSSKLYLTKS